MTFKYLRLFYAVGITGLQDTCQSYQAESFTQQQGCVPAVLDDPGVV